MTSLNDAIAAAARPAGPAAERPRSVQALLAGGGGALGAQVLEALLRDGRLHPVSVFTVKPLASLHQGLRAVDYAAWRDSALNPPYAAPGAPGADAVALCVLDRPRHANGREAAFWHPKPVELLSLARRLHHAGWTALVIVEPVDAAHWPQALREALATGHEQAIAAIGFRHLVIVRPAGDPQARHDRGLARVGGAVLRTLRFMIPQSLQPVRMRQIGRIVAALAAELAQVPPGTRVLGPEGLWQASQSGDPKAWVADWLAGRPTANHRFRPGRL
jgi:hypothetical protein